MYNQSHTSALVLVCSDPDSYSKTNTEILKVSFSPEQGLEPWTLRLKV